MKKFCVFAVLAIFLLSVVPLAIADEDNSKGRKLGLLGDKGIKLAKEVKPTLIKVQERVEKTLEKTADRYEGARDKFIESRNKVLNLKNEVKGCENGNCTFKIVRFRNQTRNHLIHLTDVVLSTLEKLKEKIEASSLSEEEKNELLADIEAKIQAMKDEQFDLEDLNGNITSGEITDSVKKVKNAWGKTKPKIQYGAGKLIQAKLGNIINSIEKLEVKFGKIKDRLESQGYDVTALNDYLDELTEKLDLAEEEWNKAKEEFQEAKNSETVSEMKTALKKAHQYQKNARDLVKEARNEIRNIVKEIKELQKGEVNGGDDNETEDEEEEVDDFESCVEAGNPVMESYPRQCSHGGQTFVEELDDDESEDNETGDDEGNETENNE